MKWLLAFIICAAAANFALADESNALRGKTVFKKCAGCHVADKAENRTGPSLLGVVGRPAATFPGYAYSTALTAKGADGWVWTEANLATYLLDPKGTIPGINMNFAGLKKPKDIADVISYLKANPKP